MKKKKIYALTSVQGTAMPETALNEDEIRDPALFQKAIDIAMAAKDWDGSLAFKDVSENAAVCPVETRTVRRATMTMNKFRCKASDDTVKQDLELTCTDCGEVVCDVEDGDTLEVLMGVASEHECNAHCGHCGREINITTAIEGEYCSGQCAEDAGVPDRVGGE